MPRRSSTATAYSSNSPCSTNPPRHLAADLRLAELGMCLADWGGNQLPHRAVGLQDHRHALRDRFGAQDARDLTIDHLDPARINGSASHPPYYFMAARRRSIQGIETPGPQTDSVDRVVGRKPPSNAGAD